jgi:hypothetical protein
MKKQVRFWSVVTSLLFMSVGVLVSEKNAYADTEEEHASEVRAKEILKVTPNGLVPSLVTLNHLDGSVFFYNATETDLITFEVDWGKRSAHCASQNLQLTEQGVLKTVRPIQPGNFGIVCFPAPGKYPVRVYGANSSPKPLHAVVSVMSQ